MRKIKDLQTLINEKARKQLDKEINAYIGQIKGNPFFSKIREIYVYTEEEDNKVKKTLGDALWDNGTIYKIIMDKMLPERIEEECWKIMRQF